MVALPCSVYGSQRGRPEWSGLPVWAIDADGLVVRPGPRLVDGVEALAAIFHPDPEDAAVTGRHTRRIA